MKFELQELLDGVPFPLIACEKEKKRVLCVNAEARLFIGAVPDEKNRFEDIVRCPRETDIPLFWETLETGGSVRDFALSALDRKGEIFHFSLSARIVPAGGKEIVLIHLDAGVKDAALTELAARENEFLYKMLYVTHHSENFDQTINEILALLGKSLRVGHTCIFEKTDGETVSNTYEWCAPEVKSLMQTYQNLSQETFSWQVIEEGFYAAEDIESLSEKDCLFLKSKGIKAVAAQPLFINKTFAGFIGCGESLVPRTWPSEDMKQIKSASVIISNLLSRKRASIELERTKDILRTVLDNVATAIYVSDIETHEVLFANKYFKETLVPQGMSTDVEGKICWQALRRNQSAPCLSCAKHRLLDESGKPRSCFIREHKDAELNRWYWVEDSAIQWVDGRYVHMENARDITELKHKEKELREKADALNVAASTDPLTNINNRQKGGILLESGYKRIKRTGKVSTLCFLDLDGLKKVNDAYGHREGDTMIVRFVEIVKEVIRGVDIFCRWGGDEFILLLEACDAGQAECTTLKRIQDKVEAFNQTDAAGDAPKYTLAFSYGMEEIHPKASASLEQVIAAADQKMYENKKKKKSG